MSSNQFTEKFISYVADKNGSKFVGIPTNMETLDFQIKQVELPKFEKSNIITINPIK